MTWVSFGLPVEFDQHNTKHWAARLSEEYKMWALMQLVSWLVTSMSSKKYLLKKYKTSSNYKCF